MTMLMMEPDGSIVHDSPSRSANPVASGKYLARLVTFAADVFAIGSGHAMSWVEGGGLYVGEQRHKVVLLASGFEDAGLAP